MRIRHSRTAIVLSNVARIVIRQRRGCHVDPRRGKNGKCAQYECEDRTSYEQLGRLPRIIGEKSARSMKIDACDQIWEEPCRQIGQ